MSNNPSIRLTVLVCINENVVPGSPNDQARTVYEPLSGTPWNIAMAEFLVAFAELAPNTTKPRLKTAIVIGMRAGLARLSAGEERKKAHGDMTATIDELFPKTDEVKEDSPKPAAPKS